MSVWFRCIFCPVIPHNYRCLKGMSLDLYLDYLDSLKLGANKQEQASFSSWWLSLIKGECDLSVS